MRILIVSDTHGICKKLVTVLEKVGKIDFLIHAGDVCGDEDYIRSIAGCGCMMVSGNNDFMSGLKKTETFMLENHRIFLTHGHHEGVYYGTDRLIYRAMEEGADVVIYGHTHCPSVEYDEDSDIFVVNPGSLSLPRQAGARPSFVLMEIDKESQLHFTINYL